MAKKCYVDVGDLADVLNSADWILGELQMPVSHAVTNQFEPGRERNETEMRQGNHNRFFLSHAALESHAHPLSMERTRNPLDAVDVEDLEPENRLGCARGVLCALAFQAAWVVAAAVYWKLH